MLVVVVLTSVGVPFLLQHRWLASGPDRAIALLCMKTLCSKGETSAEPPEGKIGGASNEAIWYRGNIFPSNSLAIVEPDA